MDFVANKIIEAQVGKNILKLKCLEPLGSGGQGDVWKVQDLSSNQVYALKVINETNANVKQNKIYNIPALVNNKIDAQLEKNAKHFGINHVFPLSYFSKDGETFYIMECVTGKTLNSLLLKEIIQKMPLERKYLMLFKIAKSIDMLHSKGLCYTDISWGNFMWDDKNELLSVIDCENVTSSVDIDSGRCAFLYGTAFFIAPEVAARKERAKFNSDRFAFASLCFRLIMNNYIASAYHGKAMAQAYPAPADMFEVIEYEQEDDLPKEWRYFIFDENHRENNISEVAKNAKNPENIAYRQKLDYVEKTWKQLPDVLKAMFQRAFKDPFDIRSRPSLSEWANALKKLSEGKDPGLKTAVATNNNPLPNKDNNVGPVVKQNPVNHNNDDKKREELNNRYKPFRPKGANQNVDSIPKAADLNHVPLNSLVCGDKIVAIDSDPFTIDGNLLGFKVQDLGLLTKVGAEYQFTSHILGYVEVYNQNDQQIAKLVKDGSAILKSGYYIKPLVFNKKIYIIY